MSRLGVSSKVLREAIEEVNRIYSQKEKSNSINKNMIKFLLNERNRLYR